MSVLYDVESACLRYVVPFRFEGTFEDVCNKVEEQKDKTKGKQKWERRTETLVGAESDLYSYIKDEFRFSNNDGKLSKFKNGCEWIFWKSDEASGRNNRGVQELVYFPNGISNESICNKSMMWKILISNVGLILFRNGLGIVWYELRLPVCNVTSEQLITFQNNLKELNRGGIAKVWVYRKSGKDEQSLYPFSLGDWVHNITSFLNVSFFAQRLSSFASMKEKSIALLRKLQLNICDVSNNDDENVTNKTGEFSPDKAILFTYLSLNDRYAVNSTKDRNTFVFYITNGYKNSYHFSEETISDIKHPFDDAYWYATQEGAAYISFPSNDNREVFTNLIRDKFSRDYFALYIKTLYQSFSLLIYASRIQKEICSVANGCSLQKTATELAAEINLFLTKSMATSVSHIHHQSEFYIYLQKRLRIREDVESVTAGLNAWDALQREQLRKEEELRTEELRKAEEEQRLQTREEQRIQEEDEKKRDEKIQAIMGIFALLGISSALTDCFDFISKFASGGDWSTLDSNIWVVEVIFMGIIGGISVVAIIFAIKAVVNAFKKKDKQKIFPHKK